MQLIQFILYLPYPMISKYAGWKTCMEVRLEKCSFKILKMRLNYKDAHLCWVCMVNDFENRFWLRIGGPAPGLLLAPTRVVALRARRICRRLRP